MWKIYSVPRDFTLNKFYPGHLGEESNLNDLTMRMSRRGLIQSSHMDCGKRRTIRL
jgi:hypothetical protein